MAAISEQGQKYMHKLHVDATTDTYPTALIKQYRAEIHRDVSGSDAHIYYSRPTSKWMLVRKKGPKFEIGFYSECPCNLL